MELFLQCKERFYNHNDLLRNMMGLLGNVAEVKELRPQLMTTEFVSEFLLLVDSTSDGIETSYNAAGVLVSSIIFIYNIYQSLLVRPCIYVYLRELENAHQSREDLCFMIPLISLNIFYKCECHK